MAAEVDHIANQIIELTAEETAEYFDRQARTLLGMSGEEFLRDLDAGRWDDVIDDPDYRDVLYLALFADVGR
ncbi:MAG: hypothetical protein H0U10_01800 [Chloroflexia bacterium]|nr:hypothetical protein [Chloroflexia bacterium]